MGSQTHDENKYGHNQTSNTHKNTHRFLVNLDPGKTPSIFSRENLLESSSNSFIFQVQENSFADKQNNKKQLISSAQKSLKTMPTLPRFPCPLEAKNMYCMDMTIQTTLYRFRMDYMEFKKINKSLE